MICDGVPSDAEQPGPRRSSILIVSIKRPQGLHEHVRRHVFSGLSCGYSEAHIAKDRRAMLSEPSLEVLREA